MDTGYGGPLIIERSVSEYIRAGVAGFHIEDQLLQKRCGHLGGKEVVGLEEYMTRIRAARAAKDEAGSDIVLIGRTDALQQHGYEEAIRRLKAAVEMGAEVGQLEGVTSREMARQAVKDMAPTPLLLNMVEHGATPIISTSEAQEMGYRIMIFSFAGVAPATKAIRETFQKLKDDGVTGIEEGQSPKSIFKICGLDAAMAWDNRVGGHMNGA